MRMRHVVLLCALAVACCNPSTPTRAPTEKSPTAAEAAADWWAAATTKAQTATPNYGVTVVAAADPGNATRLDFEIRNGTDRPFELYRQDLPWIWPRTVEFFAVTRSGRVLRTIHPIADVFGAEKLQFAPGDVLAGKYELSFRIGNLAEERKQEDIILFWSYEFHPLDAAPSRVFGSLVLPRLSS